jgi:hypothetical protein
MNYNMNMIFYSDNCNTCRNIMMLLQNEGVLGQFKKICVDDCLDKLPLDMQVPLMRLVNVPDPLYAKQIYNWISHIKFMKQTALPETQQGQGSQGSKQSGPYSFDADVLTSISDRFAFSDPEINEAMPQSYFGINQEKDNSIYTPPKDKSKIGKEEQKKILAHVESKRTQQNNEFAVHSKQMQIEMLMNDEYEKQQSGYQEPKKPINVPKKGITLIKHT